MEIYTSLNDRLQNQHASIPNIISSIDHRRMLRHPQPGKWSISDNLAHLARYQTIFLQRIQNILVEDSPRFEGYKAEDDPGFDLWREKSIDVLIGEIDRDRETIIQMISGLDSTQLNRPGIHKKFGALNIIQWTEFFILHEAHHIFTIFRLAHDVDLIGGK
jgi:uncharacterized damage-inducible protein DinB